MSLLLKSNSIFKVISHHQKMSMVHKMKILIIEAIKYR